MGQASIESETPNTPLPFCPLSFFSLSPFIVSLSRLSGGERNDMSGSTLSPAYTMTFNIDIAFSFWREREYELLESK